MPALLVPWRLFFPSALLLAPLNVLLWLAVRDGSIDWHAASAAWHGREMVFGYSYAVIAGYLLPALPWRQLLALWLLWLLGRLSSVASSAGLLPWLQLLAGIAFPLALAVLGVRRFGGVRRLRNLVFPIIMMALGLAGVVTYAIEIGWLPVVGQDPAILSAYVVAVLVMVMGGRAVPTATIGTLRNQGYVVRIVPRPRFELAGVIGMLALVLCETAGLRIGAGIVALAVAGVLAWQMLRWHSGRVFRDPETWPMHLAFFWIVLGLVLIGLQHLGVLLLPDAGALHALAAGGIGTMTLVMFLRVGRQRAGNLPVARVLLHVLQVAMAIAVTVRMGGGWLVPGHRDAMLWVAGAAWLVAYGLGSVVIVPAALRSRD